MLPTEIMHAREEWSEIFKGLKEWGVAKRANQEDHDLNFLQRLESTQRATINEKDLKNSAKDFPQQKYIMKESQRDKQEGLRRQNSHDQVGNP